jgi:hypothetical protein
MRWRRCCVVPVRANLVVLPPDEALAAARPLPDPEESELSDLTDEEWDAFFEIMRNR